MKQLLIAIILAYCPYLLAAQSNLDSLWMLWNDTSIANSLRLEAMQNLIEQGYLFSQPDSAFLLAKVAYNFAKTEQEGSDVVEAADLLHQSYEEKLSKQHLQVRRQRVVLIGSVCLLLPVLGIYLKRKNRQNLSQQQSLQHKIDVLKEQIVTLSVATTPENRAKIGLDKAKIEQAIHTKLGESSWLILTLLFADPTISNKELGAEVSLSIEGVSSSLRRMYSAFNITSKNNKKVALIMKAIKISTDE